MKRSPRILCGAVCGLFVLIASQSVSVFAALHFQNPAPSHSSPQTPQTDPRLRRSIQSAFHQERLDTVLQELSHKTGVTLTVTPDLAPRRLTGRITAKPTVSFMLAVGRVLHVSWRNSGSGYELFQTPDQQDMEKSLKRRSEEREIGFLRGQVEQLRDQVSRALSENPADREAFADFVAGCDPGAIERGLTSALEDEPIISATDQSHFHDHLFAVKPFSSLLPAQQEAASRIARDCGYTHLSDNSQVGLIAAAGGFRLGIVQPDGRDVWVAPSHQIGRVAGLNANNRENDFDADVVRQLQSDSILDLGRMPDALRQKRLTITRPTDVSHLSNLLEEVCAVGGIDFVCDCYMNSNISHYGFVFRSDNEWTVETALRQTARTFAHKMVYLNGFLEAATVVPGLDLRLEPPADVMNAMDVEAKEQRPPNTKDFLLISQCTKDQIALLILQHPAARLSMHLISAIRIYPLLHFYATLTKQQQERALTEQGLASANLYVRQRASFDALVTTGLPKSTLMKLQKSHFYVKLRSEGSDRGRSREIVSFILTPPDDDKHCRFGELM